MEDAMAESHPPPAASTGRRTKKPLLFGLLLAVVLGGAGFYATWSGLILGGGDMAQAEAGDGHGGEGANPLPDIAFVPVDPVVISLGPAAKASHLKMAAQLEVGAAYAAEVQHLMPRILDVLNGYLRAIDVAEIEDPAALVRIRAQLLRRIQIVTGEGRVRDLLVTEFVLN
jgi:flagellar FliL protein